MRDKIYNISGITFGELYYFNGKHSLDVELVEYPEKGGAPCLEFLVDNKVAFRVHIKGALELKSIIDQLVLDYTLCKIGEREDVD